MILFAAAALAIQASPAAPSSFCPDIDTPQASVCRAMQYQRGGQFTPAAEEFEAAAKASPADEPATARMLAAAGNMWIAANEPGKAAFALDKALAGTGLRAEQRGQALLDRARAAEAQDDLKLARAKADEAAQTISDDPFLWYFSAALAIREGDAATARAAIDRALSLAPDDPAILFEAGHVAHFGGNLAAARAYWTRASTIDATGATGAAAREALKLLDAPAPVQKESPAAK